MLNESTKKRLAELAGVPTKLDQSEKKLSDLGFELKPVDTEEVVWYWRMPNGNVSPSADAVGNVVRLAVEYPESYVGATLCHDNLYRK